MLADLTFREEKGITEIIRHGEELSPEQKRQILLGENILKMVAASLCKKVPAMNVFWRLLQPVPVEEDILPESDGRHLFYQPLGMIKAYRGRKLMTVEKRLLHILLHGVLGHFSLREQMVEKGTLLDQCMDFEVWQLAEYLDLQYPGNSGPAFNDRQQNRTLQALRSLGTKQLYYRFWKRPELPDYLVKADFRADDHEIWGREKEYHLLLEVTSPGEADGKKPEEEWETANALVFGERAEKEDIYRCLQKTMGSDCYGKDGGNARRRYLAAGENGRSYVEILEEFFCCRERFREREDTIDKHLYSYGFRTYGKIALIEPEECNEVREISTVVIAIDTSGSCSGSIMNRFLREVGNILRDLSYGTRFERIYVLQCDTKIREEKCYEAPSDLPRTLDKTMRGFGGTDFRPVFERVEQLQKKGDAGISCLIYLSDGEGTYPSCEPGFPVYYVLPQKTSFQMPEWVRKLYM